MPAWRLLRRGRVAERDEGGLAVAIRTFTVADGETRLGAAAGIVADSDPTRERDETERTVARLTGAGGRPLPTETGPRRHRAQPAPVG